VLKQVRRSLSQVREEGDGSESMQKWIKEVELYRDLTLKVVDQTQRRVFEDENVPAAEKIVSLFESHTDVIVKGARDVQYGHKINLSSDKSGFITYLSIEEGNPADSDIFMPVLDAHQEKYNRLPEAIVCDGGYASQANVSAGRKLGIKRVVFHKRVGISYHAMGVKTKTFKQLRNFRAGIEGNISELKRAFGAGKSKWKGYDGFKAFVWSSVICYNLVRMARMQAG
jgi:transposase, IS5 family